MKHLAAASTLVLSLLASPVLAKDRPGDGVTVRPAIQPLLEEMFQSRILFRALEDLGYTVADPQEVVAQTAHVAVGAGDADFFPSSWDTLHATFVTEAGGDAVVTKVGTLINGALQGYLVDKASYDAGVTDLAMLKDPEVAKRFDADGDGKADLAGCVPGWG
uniref:glycine betaine ABC transporter substrate-binding protein n=1 Tax=Albidovulum sp. TaxID=1872424 RepID=UPI0039B86E2B